MNEYEEIENNDRLALRLRREARRSMPAFSAELHDRVLTAIQAASASAPIATVRGQRGSHGQAISRAISWAMTVAASIALTLALAIVLNKTRTPAGNSVVSGRSATSGDGISRPFPDSASPTEFTSHDVTAKKDAEDFSAAAEEMANSASGIGDWVRSAAGSREWTGGQWGGLDRDAQRALAAVAGPLPFDLAFSLASNEAD